MFFYKLCTYRDIFCLCFMKNGMCGTGLILSEQSKIMQNLFQLAKYIKLF